MTAYINDLGHDCILIIYDNDIIIKQSKMIFICAVNYLDSLNISKRNIWYKNKTTKRYVKYCL